jgi:gamma-polyglutamate biosynthesis protein CapA
VNGVRVGFVAFSDVGPNWIRATVSSPGLLIASPEDIDRVVRRAVLETDILLVSFHFGDEYQTTSNARQRLLARAAVDAGADAVIGHHPHVAQEVEEYHGAVIAYSLGNFVFDQRFSEDTSRGMLLELDIQEKRIVSFATKELNFNAYFQPLPTWGISTTTTSSN